MPACRPISCTLTALAIHACTAPEVASAPAPVGHIKLALDPPDASGITLDIRDDQGRAATPQLARPTPGCLEADLPAPGTYRLTVAIDGTTLATIGPLALAPGTTTMAAVKRTPTGTAPAVKLVVGDFSAAAWDGWQNVTYFPWSPKNEYRRERGPNGEAIAHAVSHHAGSMFVRAIHADLAKTPIARWRWRVPGPIAGANERQNDTDDAAARVYFAWGLEGKADLLHAEALGYIWGRTRRVGEIGASPFSPKIGIICLRTGRTGAGAWQEETRDVLADYRTYFRHAPSGPVTAIAILTDTDNTKGNAEAWYGPVTLEARQDL